MEKQLTIGKLAARLALNPRTIRLYEQAGVIPRPERTESGYRLYGPADEKRLRFVKTAQRLGLTLGEIKEILVFRDRGQPPCRYVAEVIERRLAEIDERMRELKALGRELGTLHERMRAEGLAEHDSAFCHYIEHAAPTSEPRPARRR